MSSNVRSERPPLSPIARRNRRVGLICAGMFAAMLGAAYASVPLYRIFCQMTGFDGTVRQAAAAPTQVLARKLDIRFDVNIRDLPWSFTAEQTSQRIRIGETGMALFKVTNHADHPVTGRAVYNVTPEQAGPYFQKLQCFCFSDQTIQPGQTIEFPMVYFVDPAYAKDPETMGKGDITLSYTFFPAVDAPAPGKRADASQPHASSALGGQARAGL